MDGLSGNLGAPHSEVVAGDGAAGRCAVLGVKFSCAGQECGRPCRCGDRLVKRLVLVLCLLLVPAAGGWAGGVDLRSIQDRLRSSCIKRGADRVDESGAVLAVGEGEQAAEPEQAAQTGEIGGCSRAGIGTACR